MRAFQAAPLHGGLPGMVPRGDLAPVRVLVLFIDNDQAQRGKRREQCGPGADHNGAFTLSDPLIVVLPVAGSHAGMQHSHAAAENRCKAADCLPCKVN